MVQIGCPVSWHDEVIKNLCFGVNISELLTRSPVYDYETNLTFNNVYCSLCNNVSNFRYWQIKFPFRKSSDLEMAKNMSIMKLLNMFKNWITESASSELQEFCIPGVKEFPATAVNQNSHTKTLWSFCKAYSMKVKAEDNTKYNNPHCRLLISNATSKFQCLEERVYTPPYGYALIFSFKTEGTPGISPKNHDQRVQEYSCQPHKVYDPFENRCRTFIVSSTSIRLFNKSDISNSSCTFHTQTDLS